MPQRAHHFHGTSTAGGLTEAARARVRHTPEPVIDEPPDETLLGPAEVAAWLHVDADWLPRAVAREALPVMGWSSSGDPIVAACEVRAWLRRPDPYGDTT